MNPYDRQTITLKSRITRLRNRLTTEPMTLADKILVKRQIDAAREELRQHRLNRFEWEDAHALT